MKVRMLRNINGAVNGIEMGPYASGQEYELDDERAQLFIGSAIAVEVLPPPPPEPEVKVEATAEPEPEPAVEATPPRRRHGGRDE